MTPLQAAARSLLELALEFRRARQWHRHEAARFMAATASDFESGGYVDLCNAKARACLVKARLFLAQARAVREAERELAIWRDFSGCVCRGDELCSACRARAWWGRGTT